MATEVLLQAVPGGHPGAPHLARELEDLLSLAEAAALCGLSAHTLAQQAERGRLRARKVGGVWVTTRECLQAYLAEHPRLRGASRAEGR